MQNFNDAVSKLEISPKLQYQESYQTTILKWLQAHPEQCKDTTYAKIAHAMILARATEQKEKNIVLTLQNMRARGFIDYNGSPHSRRKSIFINYLHKAMPKEVLDNAPVGTLRKHEELVGKKMFDVDKPKEGGEKKAEEPKEEKTQAELPVPSTPTLDVPIELDKMPNGNFTLQLNINFTINSKG